jgi:hypothetical protein
MKRKEFAERVAAIERQMVPCQHCQILGQIGLDVHAYSVKHEVTAWLHRECLPKYRELQKP